MSYRRLKFVEENYYHVFSRGNYKSTVFFTSRDYQRFLEKLKIYKDKFKVEVVAYSLLPNHFHLLLYPRSGEGLGNLMKSLLSSHSHYLSVRRSLQGHLFQAPFKAKLVADEASFLQLFRYIALQPIKEKIVSVGFIRKGESRDLKRNKKIIQALREFPWGSYREYLNPSKNDLISKDAVRALLKSKRELTNFVESKVTLDDILAIESLDDPPLKYKDPGS